MELTSLCRGIRITVGSNTIKYHIHVLGVSQNNTHRKFYGHRDPTGVSSVHPCLGTHPELPHPSYYTYVLLQACMSYIATSVRLCLASWIRPSVEHTHTHEFSWVLMLLRRTPPAEVLQARTRLGTNPLGGLTAEDGVRRGHYALNPPLLLHFRSVRRDATLLTYH
jgi:hypothetical protein